MIVEINFLEKKEKKKIAPFLFSFLAIVLIAGVISLFIYQQSILENSIATKNAKVTQLEKLIATNQENVSEYQDLIKLQQGIENIRQGATPIVSMYHDILALFGDAKQLLNYQQLEPNVFVLDANFSNLLAVSSFVGKLLDKAYIQDVSLIGVNKIDDGYEAALSVSFDEASVKKELGVHE